MPAVATTAVLRTRSPWVTAIMKTMVANPGRWVAAQELRKVAMKTVPEEQAITVYKLRCGKGKPKKEWDDVATQIKKGRHLQVMLACITLVQHGKLDQKGRGETKAFKLIKQKKAK
jgi:hypothetical protein